MADFVNTAIPILIIIGFLLLMWYKLRVPLGEFWEWFRSMMSTGKEKTVQTVQVSKDIIYDI